MAYIVKQYNKSATTNSMTILTGGVASRIDADVTDGTGFPEEKVVYTNTFSNDTTYYFHGQIKKLTTKQTFSITLMNDDDFSETQLIKNFTVEGGADGWTDIEFIFTPVKNFNTLAFILNRTMRDYYQGETRYPVILYMELSRVNNLLVGMSNSAPLIKLGIQSKPGLITMVNGEEIRLGRSGIYEIRNGVLQINTFSVVSPGTLNVDVSAIEQQIDSVYSSTDLENVDLSRCLFSNVTSRDLTDFSLDYIYEEV